ncbi:hypothetical protein TNCV_4220631 [Trichonephila clavipes]|nr:hypothetical protein TNCV_4220631 [Trichonephila clavipes]
MIRCLDHSTTAPPSRLRIWRQAHEAMDSTCQDVLGQGVGGRPTAPTKLTELWTVLANIWQVILVERFHKLV